MPTSSALIEANIECIDQGLDLLERLDNDIYALNEHAYFNSGVGKHMRHILDHYTSLLDGVETGKVDYDARARNMLLETDTDYARDRLASSKRRLQALEVHADTDQVQVEVRSNEPESTDESPWSHSTLKRELQFLLSHTVHHYALIALILKILGVEMDERFGVAPSTLRYQKSQGH